MDSTRARTKLRLHTARFPSTIAPPNATPRRGARVDPNED